MIKKTITYTDFNDNTITEDFYFNISKSEIIDLEYGEEGGLKQTLEELLKRYRVEKNGDTTLKPDQMDSKDAKKIIDIFKKIILISYGKKSDDGKTFIKKDPSTGYLLKHSFENHPAFSELFMELATNDTAAQEFLQHVMPKEFREKTN